VTRDKGQVARDKGQGTRNKFKEFLLLATCYLLLATCYSINTAYAFVEGTKHDLSTFGPGPITAVEETRDCVFCHTPHSSITVPLWNHTLSEETYTLPEPKSPEWPTLVSQPSQPDGDSKLCLSCHDGTVALNSVVNTEGAVTTIAMQSSEPGYLTSEGMLGSASASLIGTDLSGHHPVSIKYDALLVAAKNSQCAGLLDDYPPCDYTLLDPNTFSEKDKQLLLRPTGTNSPPDRGVQCSSCHDAHANTYKFLREPYGGTPWTINTYPLCMKCHVLCP